MSVLRIQKKQNNFVILDKTCLNEQKLSWGAKGLHAYLMSLPDDWQVRVCDLQNRATNGRDSVRTLLNELEKTGYIKKSTRRNEETGRFGGIEFIVLEIPEPNVEPNLPETRNPSSVVVKAKTPTTEKPSTEFPATEKTTLINNNLININKINNKTAATQEISIPPKLKEKKAAAVFSQNFNNPKTYKRTNLIEFTAEDSLIGLTLTKNQMFRIKEIVTAMVVDNPKNLEEEIRYSLLKPQCFSACGQDFARKLNAIRSVINRGDWQTPAGLIVKEKEKPDTNKNSLINQLREVQAEKIHFEKLISSVDENNKSHFQNIIERAKTKIQRIQLEIDQSLIQSKQEFNPRYKEKQC